MGGGGCERIGNVFLKKEYTPLLSIDYINTVQLLTPLNLVDLFLSITHTTY